MIKTMDIETSKFIFRIRIEVNMANESIFVNVATYIWMIFN